MTMTTDERVVLTQISQYPDGLRMGDIPPHTNGNRFSLLTMGYIERRVPEGSGGAPNDDRLYITDAGREALARAREQERTSRERRQALYEKLATNTQDTTPAKTVKAGRKRGKAHA